MGKLQITLLKFRSVYILCGRDESFLNQLLSSSEMALSLNPQAFSQSHIRERRLPSLPYKHLA